MIKRLNISAKLRRYVALSMVFVLLLTSITPIAFADSSFDLKKGETLAFSKVPVPEKVTVKDSFTLTWNGEHGNKEVNVEFEDQLYHVVVGENTYNNKDNADANIPFDQSGEYKVYLGEAKYELALDEESGWYNEWTELLAAAEDAEKNGASEVTKAKATLTAKKAELALAEAAAKNAQKNYDEAVANYNDSDAAKAEAEKELATYKNLLDNAQAAYDKIPSYLSALKNAAKEALDKAKADYEAKKEIVDNAEAFKETLKAEMDSAKAKLDEENAKVNTLQTAVADAEQAVTDAEAKSAEDATNAWEAVAAHADKIKSSDFIHTYKEYVVPEVTAETKPAKTFAVNIYNELRAFVNADDAINPKVDVKNANGTVGDAHKVYDTNKEVVVSFDKVDNYNATLLVNGVDTPFDTESYSYTFAQGIAEDTSVEVKYIEFGKKEVLIDGFATGIKEIIVKDGNNLIANEDKVYVGTKLSVEVKTEEGFKLTSVLVADASETELVENEGVYTVLESHVGPITISATATDVRNSVDVVDVNALGAFAQEAIKVSSGTLDKLIPGEVTIEIPLAKHYEFTNIDIAELEGEVVDLEKGTIKFVAGEKEAYTLNVETKSLYNKISTFVEDDLAKFKNGFTVTDKEGNKLDLNAVAPDTEVVVKFELKSSYGFKEEPALVVNDVTDPKATKEVTVNGTKGEYTFTVDESKIYSLGLADSGVVNTQSSVTLTKADNAEVKYNYTELTVGGNAVTGLDLGTEVTLTVTPNDNYYITNVNVTANTKAKAQNEPTIVKNKGVWTVTFVVNNADYNVEVITAAPIIAPVDGEVEINKYDILAGRKTDVSGAVAKAFTTVEGVTGVEYEYLAGTIDASELSFKIPIVNIEINLGETLGLQDIPVWRDVNDEVPTAENIANSVVDSIKEKIDEKYHKYITTSWLEGILENAIGGFHTFGDVETETVRAKCADSDAYAATISASKVVTIADLRTEIDVDMNTEITVTYGSYASNEELIAKLLDGKIGVNVDGTALDAKYNAQLVLSNKKLVKADVDTYEVEVYLPENEDAPDYDYKDAVRATAIINVVKADATVTMTEDNVVKYENISKVTRDFLYAISASEVVVADNVDHVAFSLGVDAIDGAVEAKLDLSKMITSDDPVTQLGIDAALRTLIGDGKSMSLGDFAKFVIDTLLPLLEENGAANVVIPEELLAQITDVIEQYAGQVDVVITLTNGDDFIPTNHGAYVVGVVTTDKNYNTAANITYLVITSDFVTVEFVDEEGTIKNHQEFRYKDGVHHTMEAIAIDEHEDDVTATGTMTYYYAGVQSDGALYAAKEAPMHAGVYTVTAFFTDEGPKNVGMGIGTMTILASYEAEVAVTDKKVVVYDENNETPVEIADMIQVLPEGTDAKIAVITAGIDIATDFSEEGVNALEETVNIDFPERADEILKKIVPSAYTEEGITMQKLAGKIAQIKEKLEELGMNGSYIDRVVAALGDLPDSAKLTFFNTYNGEINTNALPNKIGAYLVTAVVFDPDYVPEAGAGMLFITPEITEETLVWDYNDINGIITRPVLDVVDLGANAVSNSANTAKIEYLFIAVTKDGEVSILKADESNIGEVSKNLRNGAYKQIAYIWDGVDAKMLVAEPITREFVVVPQTAEVNFNADGKDAEPENIRRFTYTGSPIEMPVAVVKADNSAPNLDCLTVMYVGADTQGNAYHSETAPTNVGVYTVTATYAEYDSNGSLKYAGMNIGTLVIEPITEELTVDVADVICENCDSVTCTPECKVAIDVTGAVTAPLGTEFITIVTDAENNVNIILPNAWNVETQRVDNKIDEVVTQLLAKVNEMENILGEECVKELKDKLNAILAAEKINSITINGTQEFSCGTYSVLAVAFGPNHMPVVADDTFTVSHKEHVHDYASDWSKDKTNHWHECYCGDKIDLAEHTFDSTGKCIVCEYSNHEHEFDETWSSNETEHWHECTVDGCDMKADVADHEGGTATCTNPANCSVCGAAYGHKDADNHVGETEIRDEKVATCDDPGYTGDTYCKSCGELIAEGEVIPATGHTYGDEWKFDADSHWNECACGEKSNAAAHNYGEDNICDTCGYEKAANIPGVNDEANTPSEDPKENPKEETKGEVTKTGDETNALVWMVVAFNALIVGAFALYMKKVSDQK